jgi:hypothetical protein
MYFRDFSGKFKWAGAAMFEAKKNLSPVKRRGRLLE